MITIVMILLVISGVAKSVKDTLKDHYYSSIFSKLKNWQYWDASKSWINKYKFPYSIEMEPKFFGSTTFLAWTTDAWHLFDTIQSTAWQIALSILVCSYFEVSLWWSALVICVVKALVSVPFQITYSALFRSDKK